MIKLDQCLNQFKFWWPAGIEEQCRRELYVHPEFITQDEEKLLYEEVQPRLKRMRYESAHWDDVR